VSNAWRIVVADDYVDGADTLALALDTYGCTPFIARDGPTALELIRKHKPHAALLELDLPRMPGWEIARAVRMDPLLARTVMITVTAWGRNSDRLQAQLNGFDAYVLKPAKVADIVRLIASRLEQLDSVSAVNPGGEAAKTSWTKGS
jgi:CheY-like chemotaxis protein